MTLICAELALAPGIPDSGFSLSYPYGNELSNSLIKTSVYTTACFVCRLLVDNAVLSPVWRQKLATGDFRKELHIYALLFAGMGEVAAIIYNQRCLFKYVDGTRLAWTERLGEPGSGEFPGLINTLKEVSHITVEACVASYLLTVITPKTIEKDQQAGIIRPYSPQRSLFSRFRSLFREKRRNTIESGLYLVGHGHKAIFWFWELNHKHRVYREFRTTNLEEGEKIYYAQEFDWGEETYKKN